ncbi:hypothetical protein [Rhizobium leucaenae]|uniref:Uncharacterized protein n=1 Tax=Rhizobium leucaenae TaxID=29450 RepID=A0A7W6ZZF1_9HYPH|nr:hypothetical protein [Rhizobium leucaenae]MBB4571414.1 hypothetical protein [Rhizobium leucaenae]
MTYHDDKPSSSSVPLVAIAIAIMGMAIALAVIHQPAAAARVWVPAAPSAKEITLLGHCSPVTPRCECWVQDGRDGE